MTNTHWDKAQAIRYDTPRPDEYPEPVVDWRASPYRAALLVHDMQRYFLARFDRQAQPASDLVANVAEVLNAARRADIPVIYTAQPGSMTPQQRGLLRDFWGPGMTVDLADRAVDDALAPRAEDLVIDKWRYSAFARTPLHDYIRETGRDQLIICGIYAHVGVLTTALDAYSRDLQTFVLADAIADFDRTRHLGTLDHLARTAARVCPTAEIVKELERGHADR
ncbi:hypothetical protein ACT17_22680 [Mycolicibacterium conceptionense]|uniref:Isochorismatase-like domain-containing protein n=1 Tax=Mycolicibacterium conceptionense TaxID=451644 RepID=A0A0J8U323_9MYCO|nr:isochorismatase family protein [Mycolicibacterium conceptionense]KMV15911.1 hypothetical protein ACT17_22680 [Mycolicibacterium conceptionense]